MNKQYNNRLQDIFKKLAFNKKKSIVGSAKSNLFFGDYDLNSVLNYRGKNAETKIYNEFKKIFKFVESNDNIWITGCNTGLRKVLKKHFGSKGGGFSGGGLSAGSALGDKVGQVSGAINKMSKYI